MRLDAGQMCTALGPTATRASGLKSQFGTMAKPLNAGIAAANGVEAAWLARAGFTSADDGIMGAQGFVATHTPTPPEPDGSIDGFLFEDNKYKFHACYHGLHAMIEGLRTAAPGVAPEDVAAFDLRTNPQWLRVCDVKAPRTGLETKFSYNWLAGMTLRGDATGSDRTFTDALAADPALADFATRVTVTGDAIWNRLPGLGDMSARDLGGMLAR